MQLLKTSLIWISRLLIGFTFIFSGFVKSIDPVGTSIKFGDYFAAMHLEYLGPYALMFAFLLSAVEFLLGVNILLSLSPRQSSYYVLLMMALMTPLTLYLALANPVSDCGCFGDALKLTNWETFSKNVVLLAAAVFYFIQRKNIPHLYHHKIHWLPSILAFVFSLFVSYENYSHLPHIDFMPYKIGTNINEGMKIPEGAPTDKYETTFIYQKGNEKKEFTLQNYPANDPSWIFVEQKSVLISKGYEPPIHDFTITMRETGEEITDIVLQDTSFTFLLIAPKLNKASDAHIDQINDLYDFAKENNYPFYALTASTDDEINDWINGTASDYPFCFTDETTLKTIIRANPGLVLLKNGVVVGKWNSVDIPNEQEMNIYLQKVDLKSIANDLKHERNAMWTIFIAIVLSLGFLLLLEKVTLFVLKFLRKYRSEENKTITNN
ncbi:MAG: DoxX family protein [Bacteroidales bacterium]|nr:DoxX family protein [Bacteroidales bacterium]